ncbi:hypothetical protein JOF40_002847 [Aeromicrobium fastidiosum]|nr:hypothetical protein [Aeromicrobium fastidiosum]
MFVRCEIAFIPTPSQFFATCLSRREELLDELDLGSALGAFERRLLTVISDTHPSKVAETSDEPGRKLYRVGEHLAASRPIRAAFRVRARPPLFRARARAQNRHDDAQTTKTGADAVAVISETAVELLAPCVPSCAQRTTTSPICVPRSAVSAPSSTSTTAATGRSSPQLPQTDPLFTLSLPSSTSGSHPCLGGSHDEHPSPGAHAREGVGRTRSARAWPSASTRRTTRRSRFRARGRLRATARRGPTTTGSRRSSTARSSRRPTRRRSLPARCCSTPPGRARRPTAARLATSPLRPTAAGGCTRSPRTSPATAGGVA